MSNQLLLELSKKEKERKVEDEQKAILYVAARERTEELAKKAAEKQVNYLLFEHEQLIH